MGVGGGVSSPSWFLASVFQTEVCVVPRCWLASEAAFCVVRMATLVVFCCTVWDHPAAWTKGKGKLQLPILSHSFLLHVASPTCLHHHPLMPAQL